MFFSHIKRLKMVLKKKFPDFKFFSLILAENPLFFPDFPDWKKSSKFFPEFPDRWEPCIYTERRRRRIQMGLQKI